MLNCAGWRNVGLACLTRGRNEVTIQKETDLVDALVPHVGVDLVRGSMPVLGVLQGDNLLNAHESVAVGSLVFRNQHAWVCDNLRHAFHCHCKAPNQRSVLLSREAKDQQGASCQVRQFTQCSLVSPDLASTKIKAKDRESVGLSIMCQTSCRQQKHGTAADTLIMGLGFKFRV